MALSEELKRKIALVDTARKQMGNTSDPEEISRIYSETREQILSPVCPRCKQILVEGKCFCNEG